MTETEESLHQRAQRTRLGGVRWGRLLVAENGVRWTAYAAVLSCLKHAGLFVEKRMARLEQRYGLSARTGRAVNYEDWQKWGWSLKGEEWTPSDGWERSRNDDVMAAKLKTSTT